MLSGKCMTFGCGSLYSIIIIVCIELLLYFLTGVLDTLQKPAVAFVRLSDSVVMQSALEAPVPVRFIFILVGPSQSGLDFTEGGRAMGSLMADWVRDSGESGEREM